MGKFLLELDIQDYLLLSKLVNIEIRSTNGRIDLFKKALPNYLNLVGYNTLLNYQLSLFSIRDKLKKINFINEVVFNEK